MKNVCYLHHNGFLIFEQRLVVLYFKFNFFLPFIFTLIVITYHFVPVSVTSHHQINIYSWLQKNGNCQDKTGTFLQFLHNVKPSYEK
jgi:hypothetical protein